MTAWHRAAERSNSEILEKLWGRAKEKLTTEEISNKFLLRTDKDGMSAWHSAAERSNSEILEKLGECTKQKLTKEEINNKFF